MSESDLGCGEADTRPCRRVDGDSEEPKIARKARARQSYGRADTSSEASTTQRKGKSLSSASLEALYETAAVSLHKSSNVGVRGVTM